jgi:REP element-mobilizing transposase RayT
MRYRILDPNGMNFLTMSIVGWIDLFTRPVYAEIVLESLRFCQKNKGLRVHAYVIMPSHLHLILQTDNPSGLASIIQSFKSHTARQFLKYIKDKRKIESRRDWILNHFTYFAKKNRSHSQYQVWQKGSHPIALYSPKVTQQKLHYIHNNPVKAHIVADPTHYLYSRASNYYHGTGLLDVTLLNDIWNDIGFVGF